jgi:hypothetical protein
MSFDESNNGVGALVAEITLVLMNSTQITRCQHRWRHIEENDLSTVAGSGFFSLVLQNLNIVITAPYNRE